jgi:sulfur-oxidizing protein SoxY
MTAQHTPRRACLAWLLSTAPTLSPPLRSLAQRPWAWWGLATTLHRPSAHAVTKPDARFQTVRELLNTVLAGAPAQQHGVRLEVAPLADNGHLVPLRVVVASPMTDADHVRSITLLSQRNPVTRMARFELGPWSGRAEVATRVRLAGTQTVVALAQLSSGEYRWAQAEVVVTESACLDLG